MKDERYLKDEFGRLPEEFPELRENFSPPLDEEFQSEAEYPASLEAVSPGPEYTPPGAPVPQAQEESRRRIIRKLILYRVAAALGIFLYLGPLGALAKRLEPLVPGAASAQLDELVKPGAPGDPEIEIIYAVRSGSTVSYYYAVHFAQFGEYSYDMSQKVINLSPYREATADPEIDHWQGYSRDPFEHEIDVSSLRDDEQYLFLEGEFELDGVKKTISAARRVIDRPPEPETGAAFTPDYSAGTIDYRAWLIPQEDDGVAHDFEVRDFEIALYGETGEYVGGSLVSSASDPSAVDPEEMMPQVHPPETLSDGETSSGWNFTYRGPANLHFWSEAKTYAVALLVFDKTTGLSYEIVTDRLEVPQEVHKEPSAKIFLTSFYSEFRCAVEFFDVDDVTKVTFEFWNPDTDTLEKSMDLTKEALTQGYFCDNPFTTDFVYENHRDYYEEQGTFPFGLIAKVKMEYNWDYGATREYEYSVSSVETTEWEASYTPEDAPPSPGWVFPGSFQVQTTMAAAPCSIVYGKPESVGPGVMSVSIRIDGEEIAYSPEELFMNQEESDYSVYENGEWVDQHGYANLLMMPCPEKYKDGAPHVVIFRVTQYIPAYGEAATFEQWEMFS